MNSQSLSRLCEDLLAKAAAGDPGRAAATIFGGQDHDLRQTVIALRAGAQLHEHEAPNEATLQVLSGEVRLTAGDDAWDGSAGDHLVIPPARHALEAVTDAAILRTVATRA